MCRFELSTELLLIYVCRCTDRARAARFTRVRTRAISFARPPFPSSDTMTRFRAKYTGKPDILCLKPGVSGIEVSELGNMRSVPDRQNDQLPADGVGKDLHLVLVNARK